MQQKPAASSASSGEQLLLREYLHRTNNELTSAISVLSLAAARCSSDDTRTVLTRVERRLRNYALLHNSLSMPELDTLIDAASYVRQLCQAMSEAKLQDRGIQLLLIDQPFEMDSERCWLLGMIISELVTNSVRHALRDGPGRLCIEMRTSKTTVECHVSDNGSCAPFAHVGHGLSIINALASRLNGTIQQRFDSCGSHSVLVFPISIDAPLSTFNTSASPAGLFKND